MMKEKEKKVEKAEKEKGVPNRPQQANSSALPSSYPACN